MPNRSDNESLALNRNAALASASHISTLQPRFGARFLLDEANAGGAGAGAGTGAGDKGAGAGAGDDKGAGAGAGSGDNKGAGADAGGQSGAGGGAGPSPYRPSGLPDHFAGKDDKETIEKLFGAVNGFREKQSAAGVVPETPDKYVLGESEKLKPYVANFDKDPVFKATREIFHKAGVTDKQFAATIGPLLESLVDGGLVAAPIDAKAMLRTMAPESLSQASDTEKETAGAKRVQDNIAWADGAKANKALPDDIASFLSVSAADSPAANKLIEWLRSSNSEQIPAMNGGGGSGLSDAQLKDRINDPRNNPSSAKFERAFAAETDVLSKKQYG